MADLFRFCIKYVFDKQSLVMETLTDPYPRYKGSNTGKRQEGKISDTQGKDFWSPTRLCLTFETDQFLFLAM
jgi:hypothetical protein